MPAVVKFRMTQFSTWTVAPDVKFTIGWMFR